MARYPCKHRITEVEGVKVHVDQDVLNDGDEGVLEDKCIPQREDQEDHHEGSNHLDEVIIIHS